MKRIMSCVLAVLLALNLAACKGGGSSAWQEQYDLGVRYLSEGNYQEAIIAFTAAIEIEPRAELYVGRGQAYVLSGETEENLAAALADFETAIRWDETVAAAWLGLADVYVRRGEYDRAMEILREALEKTGGDPSVAGKLAEMESGTFSDTSGRTRRSSHFENGELIQYWLYEYDAAGNNTVTNCYDGNGTWRHTETSEFDAQGRKLRMTLTDDYGVSAVETYEYDDSDRLTRMTRTNMDSDGYSSTTYTQVTYDDAARTQTQDDYDEQGQLFNRFVIEHNEQGIRIRGSSYNLDENGELYLDYYVEYIWNEDGSYGGFELFQVADRDTDMTE